MLTRSTPLRRVRQTDTTDTSFPTRQAQAAKPSGVGNAVGQTTSAIIDLTDQGGGSGVLFTQNKIKIIPFGFGVNLNTIGLQVFTWDYAIEGGVASTAIWYPTLICQVTATLATGDLAGVAGSLVPSTSWFPDTLVMNFPSAVPKLFATVATGVNLFAPADTIHGAHLIIDLEGAQMVEVVFLGSGTTPTSNALYKLF